MTKETDMRKTETKIDRRSFIASAGLFLLSSCKQSGSKAADTAGLLPPPNILWITCEDMSPNLGCYGDQYTKSPHIDKLAQQSIRYTNAFVTAPVCSPVRSTLISGMYATSLGTANLRSDFPFPGFVKGYPSYLKNAGYFCTNNVKTDYNTSSAKRIIDASWDECSSKAHWHHKKSGQPFFSIFNNMTTHQSRSMVWTYERFQKEVQSRLSADEIHDPGKAPVPPYYPDTPVIRKTIARYYDCITAMDKDTGALLKQLKNDGLEENTIVFFYSDHGAGLPRHKRALFDSGMHIPLLIRFPEKYRHLAPTSPGGTCSDLVSTIDLPPTLLQLAGLPVPDYMQGKPFLGADFEKAKPRSFIFGARDRVDEAYDCARSIRDERYLYIRTFMPHLSYNQPSFYPYQGEIRKEISRCLAQGKLTTKAQLQYAGPRRPREALFDTRNDPKQLDNLASDPAHRGRLTKMRTLLYNWILETRDLEFLPETERAKRCKAHNKTPYELAQDKTLYPLDRIFSAADLVGRTDAASVSQQVALLSDSDAAVRYWVAMGLHAAPEKTETMQQALKNCLNDPSEVVRIEAAAALCKTVTVSDALSVLSEELQNENLQAALYAARQLELLEEKARPVLPVMQKMLNKAAAGKGDKNMFLRFSLETAVRKLRGS